MLRLPGVLPRLSRNDSSELIHILLTDRINWLFDYVNELNEDPEMDFEGFSIYDDFFPYYLTGTDVPEKKLIELSKMMIAPKEYTPDLEIEYAMHRIVEDRKDHEEVTMETVEKYYKEHETTVPDDFFEHLWESIFWDNDYELLDEGFTLQMLENSSMDAQLGITGGLSAFPDKDENKMQ